MRVAVSTLNDTITEFITSTLAGFSTWADTAPLPHHITGITVDDTAVYGTPTGTGTTIAYTEPDLSNLTPELVEEFIAHCASWSFPNLHPDSIWALQYTSVAPDPLWPMISVAVICSPARTGRWLPDTRAEARDANLSGPETFSSDRNLSGFYAEAQLWRLAHWVDAGIDLETAGRMHMAAVAVQVAVHEAHEQTIGGDGELISDPHRPGVRPATVMIEFGNGIIVEGRNLACET